MFAFNKIRFKDKRQMFFYVTYIQTYIQGFLSRGLGRKYKGLQGIIIKYFVFLYLSPSQKTMESILGNAFSSVLEGNNFEFFPPLSANHGSASGITKFVTNGMPKKSESTAMIT